MSRHWSPTKRFAMRWHYMNRLRARSSTVPPFLKLFAPTRMNAPATAENGIAPLPSVVSLLTRHTSFNVQLGHLLSATKQLVTLSTKSLHAPLCITRPRLIPFACTVTHALAAVESGIAALPSAVTRCKHYGTGGICALSCNAILYGILT